MTYEQFITELWEEVAKSPKSWRKARKVQFEDGIDCFYNDDLVDLFIDKAWTRIYNKQENII